MKKELAYEDKLQAHGLTVGEMEDLHYQQMQNPDAIPSVPANNGGEKISDPYFKQDYHDYRVPEHEQHIYHVATEARTFSQTGAVPVRTSVPTVQKLTKESFEFQKKNRAFDGQIVHILHNPELNEKKEKRPSNVSGPLDLTPDQEQLHGTQQGLGNTTPPAKPQPPVPPVPQGPEQQPQIPNVPQVPNTTQTPSTTPNPPKKQKDSQEEIAKLTVAELKDKLDEMDVEYPTGSKKEDLVQLVYDNQ